MGIFSNAVQDWKQRRQQSRIIKSEAQAAYTLEREKADVEFARKKARWDAEQRYKRQTSRRGGMFDELFGGSQKSNKGGKGGKSPFDAVMGSGFGINGFEPLKKASHKRRKK